MDRNALLATTRTEFIRASLATVDRALPRTGANLIRAGDAAYYLTDQHRLMAAYRLLKERETELHQEIKRSIEQLLNRSFQTTYSTFRPSFFSSYAGNDLALVDATLYEDQLHINKVTAAFRNAAEEPLRDLNIRIAILFEQETINERENPFRPFLLSRSIATAIENLGNSGDVNTTLFSQLAEDLDESIADIYNAVNAHLADNGIGAELQLKIQKSAPTRAEIDARQGGIAPLGGPQFTSPLVQSRQPSGTTVPRNFDQRERALSSDFPTGKVEQLLNMVMQVAPPQSGAIPPRGGTAASGSQPASASTGTGWLGTQGMVAALHRRFFGLSPMSGNRTSNPGVAPPEHKVSDSLGPSLSNLIQHSTPAGEAMTTDIGTVRNLIFEQRGALHQATGDLDEKMTIDVVAMLFEFILRDGQIPAEVRAQLGRLQFLVLKIALRENALLTQKNHPARLLVNRIGSISIGLKQLDPSGVRVSAAICRIVETLLADRSENSSLFETMLNEFDSFIATELRASDSNVDLAVQVIESAQSRTLRFAHLTAQLAEALNGLTIDPFLHEFLTTLWVHVIERAERVKDTIATRYRKLVPDLLWSIVSKNTQQERSELVALLPGIVGTVRQGMLLEGWDTPRQQVVLNWMVDAHSGAMRRNDLNAPGLPLAKLHRHFENFITHPELQTSRLPPTEQDASAMDQAFLDEALKESEIHVQLLDPLIENATAMPLQSAEQAGTNALPNVMVSHAEVLEGLRSGVTVEITLGTVPGIGRLNWINQDASTMVLTMDGSKEPAMVSVRMFLRLLGLGRVRFIESAPLFERAVQALLQSAEQVEQRI